MGSRAPEVPSNEDDAAKLPTEHPASDGSLVQPTDSADYLSSIPAGKSSDDEDEMGGEAPCQLHRWWDGEE